MRYERLSEVRCELCHREVPAGMITQHHLVPREKGGQAEHKVPFCKPCHKQVHAVFGNGELAREFGTVAALRGAKQLQGFIKWIRKQDPGRNFRTVTSNDHPESRRRKRR